MDRSTCYSYLSRWNLETGEATRLKFLTKDIVKGDWDGYPLLYLGLRDRYFRIVSLAHVENIYDEWDEERDILF